MKEIITGALMGLDVMALFILLPNVKKRLLLASWTAFLHMLFPYIGFDMGGILYSYFDKGAAIVSVIILFCIGLQFLFSVEERPEIKISPAILAVSASLDTFSVSLSFGMLNLHKNLFIISSGIGAFVLSYFALYLSKTASKIRGKYVNRIAGMVLIVISIWSYIKL